MMLNSGVLWFVIADGRRARVLVQARRGATLEDRADLAIQLDPVDAYEPQDRPPRSHDRFGAGRHAMDKGRSLHEQEEENFLKRLADHINEAAKQTAFEHLALAAPPRALGLLRAQLADTAVAALRADLDKDLLDEDEPSLRERLTEMLR